MASIEEQYYLHLTPSGSALDERLSRIDIDTINVVDINVSGTFNGGSVMGSLVFTTPVQTVTNKSFDDSTTRFIDTTDSTIAVAIDAAGAAGTTGTVRLTQAANRTYTVPDSGNSCSFVMTEGAQTINGAKTFASLATDVISEVTADHGVYIDGVRIREDTLLAPSMTLASITPVGAGIDISLGLITKGAGGIIANIPDNTMTGGNIRGVAATDLQSSRNVATQVASGDRAVICGGDSNTSGGINSFVGAGATNTNTGTNAVIGGGDTNISSALCTTVAGGSECEASAPYATAGGRRAKAQHDGTLVVSDSTAADFASTVADQYSARFTNGFRLIGSVFNLDDRINWYVGGQVTTNGAVGSNIYAPTTSTNTVYLYRYSIVASTAAGSSAVFQGSAKVKNTAGTLTLSATFDNFADTDAPIAGATVIFNTSGTQVLVTCGGVAATLISWAGELKEIRVAM
jgi:hypothetical protein